jgi:hypothetical protein
MIEPVAHGTEITAKRDGVERKKPWHDPVLQILEPSDAQAQSQGPVEPLASLGTPEFTSGGNT